MQNAENSSKPKIIYVYDPLCGWCYGFSSTIQRVYEERKQELDIEVIAGGMILGNRVGPLSQIAPYIREAYKDVENTTGVKFGTAYLDVLFGEASVIQSSWEPSLALAAFKQFKPAEALSFAKKSQDLIYQNGHSPTDLKGYIALAQTYGIQPDVFEKALQSPETKQQTELGFQASQKLGVEGFPTVFVEAQDSLYLISRGYVDYATLNKRIQQALTKNH